MFFNRVIRILFLMLSFGTLVTGTSYGDLFVSAASRNSVMRFDSETGQFLGDFVAPGSGGLGDPQGIAFGPDGNLYVASNGSNNVLRFNGQTGQFIDVFATATGMSWPAEINFRGEYLYVSDFSGGASGRVSRFDAQTGALVDHFITAASFADGQSWDSDGNILISEFVSNSVRKYDGETGNFIEEFVASGSGGLRGPLDNIFLPNGNFLVSSFNTGTIKQYDADGNYIDDPITGLFGGPQGLEIGPDGMLYAGDFGNGVINKYDIDTLALIGQFATTGGLSSTNNFVFSPHSIPEPTAIGILAVTIFGVLLRRRRS